MTVSTSPIRVFVGVDVCKETLDVHVLFPDASADACAFSVPNTPAGIDTLRQKLKPYHVQLLVVESTGGYERRLVIELLTAGLAVAVVNPTRVRRFAEALARWPRPTALTPACSRSSRCGWSRGPAKSPRRSRF